MAYFKINGLDFSKYVNSLKVSANDNYVSQTNAAGNTVVDYINTKYSIEVGIIPLNAEAMEELLLEISSLNVSISFRHPATNELWEDMECIIPTKSVEYYTIQADNVLYKGFNLTFTEL